MLGVVGSRAYGLDHADSDTDRAGVWLRPTTEFLGLRMPNDDSNFTTDASGDDATMHEVGKFARLVLSANPTVSEMLWLEGYEVLDERMVPLLDMRGRLFGARAVRAAFLGYASSQLAGAERGKSESKREKFGRHLYRLVHEGVGLHREGVLTIRVADREAAFEAGRRSAAGDLDHLRDLLAWAEGEFDKPSALPETPDEEAVNEWLTQLRLSALR